MIPSFPQVCQIRPPGEPLLFQGFNHVTCPSFFAVSLFAADAPPAGGDPGVGGLSLPMMTAIVLLFVGYIFVWLPERRKQKAYRSQLSAIKKNDRIVTIGGIYGIVSNVNREADRVTIKVDENTKIEFTMSSISRVLSEASDKETANKDTAK